MLMDRSVDFLARETAATLSAIKAQIPTACRRICHYISTGPIDKQFAANRGTKSAAGSCGTPANDKIRFQLDTRGRSVNIFAAYFIEQQAHCPGSCGMARLPDRR